jgi:hypothetical protein
VTNGVSETWFVVGYACCVVRIWDVESGRCISCLHTIGFWPSCCQLWISQDRSLVVARNLEDCLNVCGVLWRMTLAMQSHLEGALSPVAPGIRSERGRGINRRPTVQLYARNFMQASSTEQRTIWTGIIMDFIGADTYS